MAFARNTRTGKTTSVPDHYIGDPVLGKWLVPVGADEAAPKKKTKKQSEPEVQISELEQPAPEENIENEENEDGN